MVFAFIGIAAAVIAIIYYAMHSSSETKTVIVDVVGAIDGRTVEIMVDNRKERVILGGIGFPRGDQKSERDCAETVQEVVVGRRLYMEIFKEVEGCKYVTLKSSNGDCLNSTMLSKGLARYESTGIGFVGDLIEAENKARNEGLGVWDKNRTLYNKLASTAATSDMYHDSMDEMDIDN